MRIQELITQTGSQDVISIQQEIGLPQVAGYLCVHSIGALPVVDGENNVVGIISERDIIRTISEAKTDFFSKKVFEVMTTKVSTCSVDDLAEDIYRVLCDNNIRHIPVVKYNKLLAMLSIRDFEKVHNAVVSQSLTDELTGLYNLRHCRSLLDGEFNQFRRFQSPFSLASIVVDDYHMIAEIQGVLVVDRVLKMLGALLKDATRSFDNIARVDEDRFIIIFHNTDREAAIRACDRIFQSVTAETSAIEGGAKFVISIGLAIANEEDRSGEEIMKRADMLANDAKSTVGNSLMIEKSDNIADISGNGVGSNRACA